MDGGLFSFLNSDLHTICKSEFKRYKGTLVYLNSIGTPSFYYFNQFPP
jgi:hypothetical protein